MNVQETSNEFDILYNQVNSNQAASIDEFEKSVFLTRAQDDIVKAYADPRGNKFIEGLDDGQKRQYDFSSIIKNEKLSVIDPETHPEIEQYDPRSYIYVMPNDFFLTLNERIYEEVNKNGKTIKYQYQITPISYAMYGVLMKKAYQYPTKREVWRIITGQVGYNNSNSNNQTSTAQVTPNNDKGSSSEIRTYCEIIGRFKKNEAPEYKMRYVRKPTPIVLLNLRDEYENLSVDGFYGDEPEFAEFVNGEAVGIPCHLPEGIHHEIVQRAVELATAVYNPQALNSITGIGNVSSTNLGTIPRQDNK